MQHPMVQFLTEIEDMLTEELAKRKAAESQPTQSTDNESEYITLDDISKLLLEQIGTALLEDPSPANAEMVSKYAQAYTLLSRG